jgi:hypothetical protein
MARISSVIHEWDMRALSPDRDSVGLGMGRVNHVGGISDAAARPADSEISMK